MIICACLAEIEHSAVLQLFCLFGFLVEANRPLLFPSVQQSEAYVENLEVESSFIADSDF